MLKTGLSEVVRRFLQQDGHWADPIAPDDVRALEAMSILLTSAGGEYFLHVPAATTSGRRYEIDNLCWLFRRSSFKRSAEFARKLLGESTSWVPISSWEGDGGFFFEPGRDHVAEITAGPALRAAIDRTLEPQWKSFNAFLEWHVELE